MRCTITHSVFRWPVLAGVLAAYSAPAMTTADLAARLAANERLLLVDVRSPIAYGNGHIPGAINIPFSLLPEKQVPTSARIVVYGDGLGVVDDLKALAITRAKKGVVADVLEGGYAAWLSDTRLSTALPGVGPEKMPGITYQQLVAARKDDMVLVDLRTPLAPMSAAAAAKTGRPSTAAMTSDVLADFARKIGVPVVAPDSTVSLPVKTEGASANTASSPARAAATVDSVSTSNKLLVLVADSDAEANAAARRLRARGNFRFTILIGGTEIIRHDGKQGSGRMEGNGPLIQSPR